MASFAPAAEPARRARTQARPREQVAPAPAQARRRPSTGASQRRLAGGAVWIGAASLLLAGVVAVNVAVLRLNLRLDELGRERTQLRADNARLSAELAGAAATLRIQQLAAAKLGLVAADGTTTTYVRLPLRSR
ncbi:MAG: hypothetical protein ABR521_05735 [Gaiellaceae bacterium]